MSLTLPDPFTDGRVVLRPPADDDVDWIHAACQDPDVLRFTTVPSPYERRHAEEFVARCRDGLETGGGAQLLVTVDGVPVGAAGIGIDRADRRAVVGYWITAATRGQGVATAAARLLCRWAFDELGVAKIELDAAASNAASNAVARRLGFIHEGTRRSAMVLAPTAGRPEVRDDANDWGCLPGELR